MLKYTGQGFLPGIPARDLTDEEAKEHGGETKLLASGLYEKSKSAARAKSAEPQEEGDQ